jgi:hypothetical protein
VVKELYLMGGEHAAELCKLKSLGAPDCVIKMQNDAFFKESISELSRLGQNRGLQAPTKPNYWTRYYKKRKQAKEDPHGDE